MDNSIEMAVARRIAHEERTQKILARTGGEVMHPDHYDLREAIRLAVLSAIDEATEEQGAPRMSDGALPFLFKTLDEISNRIFLQKVGLI